MQVQQHKHVTALAADRKRLALCHACYGGFGLVITLLGAIISTIMVLLSREMIMAVIMTTLRPIIMDAFGQDQGNDLVEWLLTLLRFSPIIFGLLAITVQVVAGFIVTSPYLATSYALYKGKDWWLIPAVIASILALPLVPFGTLLALYTAYFFYLQHNASPSNR